MHSNNLNIKGLNAVLYSKNNIFFAVILIIFAFLGVHISYAYSILYFTIACFGILSLYFLFTNEKIWIYSIAFLLGFFFSDTGEGVSAGDILFLFLLNIMLIFWFIKSIFIRKITLFDNKMELIFFWSVLLIPITSINIFFNELEFLIYFREYLLFSMVLIYFPLKKNLEDWKSIKLFLLLFLFSAIIAEISQLFTYKNYMVSALYAYQLAGAVRVNQLLFVSSITFSVVFFIYYKNKALRTILLFNSILGSAALITTFSRVFWVSLIFNLFIVFLLIENKKKLLLITVVTASFLVIYLIVESLFGNISNIVFNYIERRFSSTTKGTDDISALARIKEWEVVLNLIKDSPLIGKGYGYYFTFKNPAITYKEYALVIHNAYLALSLKIGIPLAISFISVLIVNLFKSFFLFIKIKDRFFKVIAFSCFAILLNIVFTSFFTQTFSFRDGIIIFAVILFLVNFLKNEYNLGKLEK